MDQARYFEYVYRLPEVNRNQLGYKEDVYDRQILLNEEWAAYALRRERGEAVASEEHVKWITETWEDCENRKTFQKEFLEESKRISEAQKRVSDMDARKKREKSDTIIDHMMRYQHEIDKTRTPCRHNLYVDFQALQQERFRVERELVEFEEYFFRTKIEQWEDCNTFLLGCAMQWSYEIHDLARREREQREEEERLRLLEEARLAEEERIRLEEQRKRDEEEAERQRREQAEIDKRLERKKREEMRRAKSRADRQRQVEQEDTNEGVEEKQPELEPEVTVEPEAQVEPEPEVKVEAEPEPEQEPEQEPESDEVAEQIKRIMFTDLQGDNIVSLLVSATKILSSGGDHSYIMSIRKKPQDSSTVICQNGIFGLEEQDGSHLLGKKIVSDSCVSTSSSILHENVSTDLQEYLDNNIEHISDVRADERCHVFREGIDKQEETLVLYPISLETSSHSPFVVALSREGCGSISSDDIISMGKLVFELGRRIRELHRKQFIHQLCQQCVDWLSLCMGCDNVYISLDTERTDILTYVATTPTHRFLLGQHHSRVEETEGKGISFSAMDLSVPDKKCSVTNFPDVSKESEGPLKTENIRFFQESQKKGPLMIAPITGCKDDAGISLGCVFVDRIGTKKKFSSADEEVMRMATQMLADLMLGNIPLETDLHLKVEEEVDSSSLTFLKILWERCLQNLGNITSSQLLELAKYLHPPEVIPKVVQSTLLVTLRCKPSKISEWDNARKKVTQKLLTKMGKLDPTNTVVTKNAFFVRARKLVKGLTAETVFEHGSFPTQCFFNWVFAAILLRKHTMALRKRLKEGVEFDDTVSLGSFETNADSIVSDDENEPNDMEEDDNADEENEETSEA